jgi:hypothetical protein
MWMRIDRFDSLVEEILDQLPEEVWTSTTTTFLDPAIGGGQFVWAIEQRLKQAGHSNENIKNRVFGFEESQAWIDLAINMNSLIGTYEPKTIDEIIEMKLKFDIIVGNPPFNESSKSSKTIAGTSGNTTLYKKFIDLSFKSRKKGGIVALVTQRNGIKHALKKHNVTILNADTSKHWGFTAGWFMSIGDNSNAKSVTSDSIITKTYDLTINKRFRHAIGGSYENIKKTGKFSDVEIMGSVYGIVDTPKKDMLECKFAWITGTVTPAGPKLIFPGLGTKLGYVATDLPSYAGSTCTLFFDTLQEAKAAKLFVLNNPIITYLNKMLNEKSRGFIFRYVRPFDLGQIKTGFEIPKEFGLTQEEIAKISANI